MQEPQFAEDLAAKLDGDSPPVPALPRKILKRKVPNFLKKGVYRSLGLHLAFLLAFPLYQFISRITGWEAEREARLRALEMQRTAIRVDVVDLPSLKLSELQNVDLTKEVDLNPPKEEPQVEEKAKPSETAMIDRTKELEKAKEKKAKEAEKKAAEKKRQEEARQKKAAEERLKELRERLKADQRRKELVEKLKKNTGGRQALGGNVLSEGYSTTGDVATEADAYLGKARAHVHKYWNLPAWMKASELSAVVLVKIAPNGRVITKEFLRRSGNSEFDSYVERAIEAADPFPAPPDSLKHTYMEEGIEWGFPR